MLRRNEPLPSTWARHRRGSQPYDSPWNRSSQDIGAWWEARTNLNSGSPRLRLASQKARTVPEHGLGVHEETIPERGDRSGPVCVQSGRYFSCPDPDGEARYPIRPFRAARRRHGQKCCGLDPGCPRILDGFAGGLSPFYTPVPDGTVGVPESSLSWDN
jgi:hypothetical protein